MSQELLTVLFSTGGLLGVLKALSMAFEAKARSAAKKEEAEAALLQSNLDRVRMLEAQALIRDNRLTLQEKQIHELTGEVDRLRRELAGAVKGMQDAIARADAADIRARNAVTELADYRMKR